MIPVQLYLQKIRSIKKIFFKALFLLFNEYLTLNIYRKKILWKLWLLIIAVLIGFGSLIYTNDLVERLKSEEKEKAELWAEATRKLIETPETNQDIDFLYSIIENNTTVPVILTDDNGMIISAMNFDKEKSSAIGYLEMNLAAMKERIIPITVDLGGGHFNYIYYKDSIILTKLIYYPYVQLGIIILFIIVSYVAFSTSRKAEQNQVWVGMSKETAHQLGTPTSSLAGWVELMEMKYPEVALREEIAKDVERLEKVTERFSKIGSKPALVNEDVTQIIIKTIDYLKSRTSSRIKYVFEFETGRQVLVPMNSTLFEWVVENICKNAIDAVEGDGTISFNITEHKKQVDIDISDSGKGIPSSAYKSVFKPGFSTKKKGWGLGLSLSKRIIEDYHNGKIFVKHSEAGKGSCLRISMKIN
jgi:signal transduction histidine kinase